MVLQRHGAAAADAAISLQDAPSLDRSDLSALADSFLGGVTLDADAIFAGTGRRRVPLPVYPFAETRYWVDEVPSQKLLHLQPLGSRPSKRCRS